MAWGKRRGGAGAPRRAARAASARPGGEARLRGPRAAAWLCAGVLVVAAALLSFLPSAAPAGRAVSPKPPPSPAPSAPPAPRVPRPARTALAARPAPAANAAPSRPAATAPASAQAPGRLRLPDGRVLTFPPPKEGETRRVHAYGRTYVCDHLGNFRDVTPRRLFHSAFEANFLALASEGRAFIPAFLVGLDEADVRAMLSRPREPLGDETEDELRRLDAYDGMRRAVLDYMDAGGRFDDFVEEAAALEREERLARAAGLREVMERYRAGRLAEARAAADAAAALAAERGFRALRLPPRVRAALDALPPEGGAGGE